MKVLVLSVLAAVVSEATELTSTTWDDAVAGKSVFVKFQAPWCGHCKKMKPDWDSLMTDYQDSKTTLIADVDCTAGGEALCKKHGVTGYPTIKYGDPSDLKVYEGGRSLSDFKKFAEENLGPTCGPSNLDLCDEADKKLLVKYAKWDMDELDMSIEENDEKVNKIEKAAQKAIDSLNGQVKDAGAAIEKENKKKDDKIAKETKKLGLKFMKAVKAARTPKATKEEEEKKEEL